LHMRARPRSDVVGVIVLFPGFPAPYSRLLYRNVAKCGVDVYLRRLHHGGFLDLVLKALQGRRGIRIVHLHLIEFCFRSHSVLGASMMAYNFVLKLVFLRFIMRLRIVITLHNAVPHERLYPKIEHVVFALALRLSDRIIVHNNYSRKLAERIYKVCAQKMSLIPHGNFLDYYSDTTKSRSRAEARKKLGIPMHKFVLLFFGRIRHYKGVQLLLQAFKKAVDRNPNLFLVIAGKPWDLRLERELREFQRHFPANCLIEMGYVPDSEVQAFMNAADVGILPYHIITTPGSLLLFMSFGKPTIAPRLPPIEELVSNDFCILYEKNDPDSLVEAILTIATTHGSLSTMGKKALERAKAYDWMKAAHMTSSLYSDLLRNS